MPTETIEKEYLVLGGGVSGLTFAHDLKRAGKDFLLVEREEAVGGCARTELADGYLFEKGPFNVLVRNPLFESLLQDLKSQLQVITPNESQKVRELLIKGKLQQVPHSLGQAISTPILTLPQKLRILLEPLMGKRPTSPDPTLGDLVRRRLGNAVADRIVSAVVSGIYGGDCDRLSARSCFPLLWEVDQSSSSLFIGFIKRAFNQEKKKKRVWKGMVSFERGLGHFCQAIADQFPDRVLTHTSVTRITHDGNRYRVLAQTRHGEMEFKSNHLVMATDLPGTLQLLDRLAPSVCDRLRPIELLSLAVVNLGFNPNAFVKLPYGFGFLVPAIEKQAHIMGVLYASSVFPHHAPAGHHSLRIFVGGTRSPEWVNLDDGELLQKSLAELSQFIPVKESPTKVSISRWPAALPQMTPGHYERIEKVQLELKKYPGLHLIGNYLEGVSINDCVTYARKRAAEEV